MMSPYRSILTLLIALACTLFTDMAQATRNVVIATDDSGYADSRFIPHYATAVSITAVETLVRDDVTFSPGGVFDTVYFPIRADLVCDRDQARVDTGTVELKEIIYLAGVSHA